jgi:hypothetical protein
MRKYLNHIAPYKINNREEYHAELKMEKNMLFCMFYDHADAFFSCSE